MERIAKFFRDVRMEFSKVSWPSRLETTVFTVLVIAMIAVLSVVIFSYDIVFSFVTEYLRGLAPR